MKHRRVVVSESDFVHLNRLIDGVRVSASNDCSCLEILESELEAADVLKQRQVPANVVQMNSQVHVMDLASGQDTVYRLVFPQDADMEHHRVSILTPLGAALLGSRVGQLIVPITPRGPRRLRVGGIVYQRDAVPAA